ncbi:hypothetical protein J19TS2_43470 [Cohnella xylanilytica]|nr:hypothetical protein J19TS2_43470 [Cohnella xylanilytica]
MIQLGQALAQTGLFGGGNKITYEQWLSSMQVHDKFKLELERLSQQNHSRSDLMIAYTFLFYEYGQIKELEPMVVKKESGIPWDTVFTEYLNAHEKFEPRTFDTEYLEGLTTTSRVTADDIMIADRLSFASGEPLKTLISDKMESGQSWGDIAVELGIVNGSETLPRVQITADQMEQFVTDEFPEERVAEAFVLAQKVYAEPKDVVAKMKGGRSESFIMAEFWSSEF